jgi:hypothetical protein
VKAQKRTFMLWLASCASYSWAVKPPPRPDSPIPSVPVIQSGPVKLLRAKHGIDIIALNAQLKTEKSSFEHPQEAELQKLATTNSLPSPRKAKHVPYGKK